MLIMYTCLFAYLHNIMCGQRFLAFSAISSFLCYNIIFSANNFLGRKAGFLGSAYYFGNLVGSPFWGWISDIWGRRPVMLIGIVGSIGSHFIFGFR